MKCFTPEQIIQCLKSDRKYYDISRDKIRRKLLREGEFLLRPSTSVKAPDFEMFVMSYATKEDYENKLYGISKISGQCFRFDGKNNSTGKFQPLTIVGNINYKCFSARFEEEINKLPDHEFNGLILSTQTPDTNVNFFPRGGGTAIALHHFTGLPFVQMHRNAEPTKEESPIYAKLKNESTVFITGHGNKEAEALKGIYIAPNEGVFDYSFPLGGYRDLLVNNSQLQTGDTLNIVLWCCKGATGIFNSTAAKLAKSFWEKGIGTRILASTENLGRFNGRMTDGEMQERALSFRVKSLEDLHMIECLQGKIRFYQVADPIYFGSTLPDLAAVLVIKRYEELLEADSLDISLSVSSDDSELPAPASCFTVCSNKEDNKIVFSV